MKIRIFHILAAFIVAVFVLNLGKVSMAADEETNPYSGITQEMFDKCIKTDIFETNRNEGWSEYDEGNNGTVKFLFGLLNTPGTAATLTYNLDSQQERLAYTLTWNLPLTEKKIWSGIGYTVKECKKRCANGC